VLAAVPLTPYRAAGTILGVALIVTFVVSVTAIVQRNHVTFPLELLNWALLIDAIGIVVIGTFVWFYTLRERANFYDLWKVASREDKLFLQDKVRPFSLLISLPLNSPLSLVQMLRVLQWNGPARNWWLFLHQR
jgi:hypothetical protein